MTEAASQKKYNAIAGRKGKGGQWVLTCDKGRFISEGKQLSTLVAAFSDTRIMFAALRVDGVDVQDNVTSVRSKMVRLDWVGPKVAAKQRSKSLTGKATISELFTGTAGNQSYTEKQDITMLAIAEHLLNSGGAHKPTKYDFGGGEEISLSDVQNHKNPTTCATTTESKSTTTTTTAPAETTKPKKKKKKPKYGGGPSKPAPTEATKGKRGANVCWILENFVEKTEKTITITTTGESDLVDISNIKVQGRGQLLIKIVGKCNKLLINQAQKVAIVCENNVVSIIEIVRCKKLKFQALGACPTIQLSKSEDCTFYLPRDFIKRGATTGLDFFTEECNGINISHAGATEDDDQVEVPLPNQIKTIVDAEYNVTHNIVPLHDG